MLGWKFSDVLRTRDQASELAATYRKVGLRRLKKQAGLRCIMGAGGGGEMTLTIELTEEQEQRLAAKANGKSMEEFVCEILAQVAEQGMTGAELLAYWKRE